MPKKVIVTCSRCKTEFVPRAWSIENELAVINMETETWELEGTHLRNFDMCIACMGAFYVFMGLTVEIAIADLGAPDETAPP